MPPAPPTSGSASPAPRPHARHARPRRTEPRGAGHAPAPQTPDWSGAAVGAGASATSYNLLSRQDIFALSMACQERTIRPPFKTIAPAFKLGAAAPWERLNTVKAVAAGEDALWTRSTLLPSGLFGWRRHRAACGRATAGFPCGHGPWRCWAIWWRILAAW